MPHLSPLKWSLYPSMFWLTFIISICAFWWLQSPKISSPPQILNSKPSSPWKWT